jgi:simple sugar transport system permease protein
MLDFFVNWIASVPGLAVPYALGALGLIISERAGVMNLTAEGLMLVGAMSGIGAYISLGGDPWLALVASALSAMAASVLFALLTVVLRVNQVIAGIAFVFFCQGATTLTGTMAGWVNHAVAGMPVLSFGPLSTLPVVGHIVFSQDIVVYLTIPIFIAVQRLLFHSKTGLRLRAVGETPDAADAAGIGVPLHRFAAVVGGACLIGLAGGYISVVTAKIWISGMTAGRGWIAVALVIFARWRPWRALGGALLFGCIEGLIPRVAAAGIKVPQYFVLMTPYIATIVVMTWATIAKHGRSEEPGALGQPFVREERR